MAAGKLLEFCKKQYGDSCKLDISCTHCERLWEAATKAAEEKFTSHNKQMVAALWRALSHKDVNTRSNSKGVWLPLTKKRLNAAYTKVFGL